MLVRPILRRFKGRLFAAVASYRLGLKSVDYTLKRHFADEIGEYWVELAKQVDHDMADQMGQIFAPRHENKSVH